MQMRIGIDIRALQSAGRDRGIGYYVRGLIAGLDGLPESGAHEFVFLTLDRPEVPPRLEAPRNLSHTFAALPFLRGAKSPWRLLEPVRYLRWLNPAHARRRGMRYDDLLFRRLDMAFLARAARRARLDVLHLPSVFEPEFFANASPCFPCPVVQTVYDMIPMLFPEVNRAAGWRFWNVQAMGLRSLAEGVGPLIAISESARRDTERFVPESTGRVSVIPCGVGDHFAPPDGDRVAEVRARYGLGDASYFLFSGGCEWRKNLTTALAAFARVRRSLPEAVLAVPSRLSAAEIELVTRWAREAGLAVGTEVCCTGFVADADLPALYAGALALVFPSRYEGFGLPVVEAMRCGCPVVTADNSSLGEVAGDAALLIEEAEDADALARAMQRVVCEPHLADQLRARGLVRSRLYTWRNTARQVLDVYQSVAPCAAPASPGRGRWEDRVANRL